MLLVPRLLRLDFCFRLTKAMARPRSFAEQRSIGRRLSVVRFQQWGLYFPLSRLARPLGSTLGRRGLLGLASFFSIQMS